MSAPEDRDIAAMFAAGAYSAATDIGLSDHAARSFASRILEKSSASKKVRWDEDDDDDDEDTWWNRNKGWALPTAIGLGAFLVGSDAGRYGRKDRNYFSNAGNRLLERLKNLFGIPDSDRWRMMTQAPVIKQPIVVPSTPASDNNEYPKGSV